MQSMDKNFKWTILREEKGSSIIHAENLGETKFEAEPVNVAYVQYISLLKNIQRAIKSQKTVLQLGCTPLPYYVIKLNNSDSIGKSLIQETVYIDTLTYLIHASTMVAQGNDGSVILETFTIEYQHFYHQPLNPSSFQLNKNMLHTGDVAPDFSLKDVNGNTINLSDLKGKIVLLDFWYVACKPCIKASYKLDELQKEFAERGVVILGMNTMDKSDKIKRHNKKHKISYNSILCTREMKARYKIKSYPSFYLIDQSGTIIFSTSGYSAELKSELKSAILQALSKR
jgi:peroxiredoxin